MVLACHLGRYIPPSQTTYACYPGRSPAGDAATRGRDLQRDGRVSDIPRWSVGYGEQLDPRPNRQTLNYDIMCMSMVVEVAKAFMGEGWGVSFGRWEAKEQADEARVV